MADNSSREALPASVPLGRLSGIAIGLHYSWFVIAGLITFSLAGRFRVTQPEWETPFVWAVAASTAVLFFITLLVHELSHSLVARARGLPVRSITLFALGGVANIEKDANTAKTEFLVAIVGPITSAVIGLVAIAAAQWMGWSPEGGGAGATAAVLGWLGSINLLLAIFNLIPGYPLDGGRVLRAALWGVYKDGERATRHAARVGQFVAGLFIAVGLFQFVGGAGFSGLWLALIGWFLLLAAQGTYAQVSVSQALRDVRVADIMANDCATVDAGTSVRSLVDDLMLRTGRRCVMVHGDSRVLGLVTPRDIREVDRSRWVELTAADVMRSFDTLRTVTRETPVNDALATMVREDVNQLPVVDHGHLEGMVSRTDILRLVQARSELRA